MLFRSCPNPKCVKDIQDSYYKGCKGSSKFTGNEKDIEFYNFVKKISKNSIFDFIENHNLKPDELTRQLLESQQNKYYMLYKNGKFHLETINKENYEIIECKKEPNKSRYIVKTKTGIQLKVLLRWKNGNGIAYPAFQIS